jgi:hypothetical protein
MKLLVSPADIEEAMAAVRGGADIIDIKNPREGALGANFPWIIREIRDIIPQSVEISATLGDLEFKPGTASLAAFGLAKLGVDYVKAGFYGIVDEHQAIEMADMIKRSLEGSNAKLVLAGYGDFKKIGSISPMKLPTIAAEVGAYGVMIDTALKNGRSLLANMKIDYLKRFIEDSHELDLTVALAGSLGYREILQLKKIKPDIIGVRSLVCDGDRVNGKISEKKVRELISRLRDSPQDRLQHI